MTDRIISIGDKLTVVAGDEITVPVILSDATDIIGIDLQIQYNNQVLELISSQQNIKKGDITANQANENNKDWSVLNSIITNGNINTINLTAFTSLPSVVGVGTIVEITFTIKDTAAVGTISPLQLRNAGLNNLSRDDFDILLDNGIITITDQSSSNFSPTLVTPITDQTTEQNSNFNFKIPDNIFNDFDNETLIYSANLINNNTLTSLPEWLSFDPEVRTFTGIPENEDVGDFEIKVKVADGQGEIAETEFTLNVENINDIPELINPIPNFSIFINQELNFQIPNDTFIDIDEDQLTYKATLEDDTPLPDWLNFNPNNQTFTGTPTNQDLGETTIKIEVDDGNEGIISDLFNLKVIQVNTAPIVANPIANVFAEEDNFFVLEIPEEVFTDADYHQLSYSASLDNGNSLPSWLTFNPNTRLFSGTPRNIDIGTQSIKVTVNDDNDGQVSNTFNLTVANTNDEPILANSIPDMNTAKDSLFNFQIPVNTFTDEDNDNLTYSATLANNQPLPNWLSFDPDNLTFSGTPTNNQDVGTIEIKVIANDGNGGTVRDIFNLTVISIDDDPADLLAVNFDVISDRILAGETQVTFSIKNEGIGTAKSFKVDLMYSQDRNIGDSEDLVIRTLSYENLEANDTLIVDSLQVSLSNNIRNALLANAINDDPIGLGIDRLSTNQNYLGLIIYDNSAQLIEDNTANNSNQGKGQDLDDITLFPWDINNDGRVTPMDAIFIINNLGETITNNNQLADVNNDNLIDNLDAIASISRLGYRVNSSVIEV